MKFFITKYNFTLNFFLLYAFVVTSIGNTQAQSLFKEEKLSATRAQIILNGVWDFQPAVGSASQTPQNKWGSIQVPGAWEVNSVWWQNVPGIIKNGDTDLKEADLKNISRAWYRQTVAIPKGWKGREVTVAIDRVATDAVIYINGKRAGTIEWYAGKVNIAPFVKYGAVNEIRILVIATPDEGEVANLMGTAEAQVSFSKATLATRGITGNIILSSHAKGIYITDVFVQTSVRKHNLLAEVEITGIKKPTDLLFTNVVYDAAGNVAKTYNEKIIAAAADTQVFKLQSTWNNPKVWDLDQPNMYRLKTTVSAAGKVLDEYVQSFGFREFWIDGKNFYLNGTRINLRPTLTAGGDGMHEIIAASIDGLRKSGFNFNEIWPNNFDARGDIKDWHELMDVADSKGFLLSGVALPFSNYIVDNTWSFQWNKPGVKEKWQQRMLMELKRQRNHPSVVMWGTTANFFGHAQDQDPLHIGQAGWIKGNDFWQRNATAGEEAINIIKQYDATRPVFTHHGAYVGDVHTLNFYLNLIPLQEREEWMSHYATHGKLPFIGIEFGTPLHCTFLRGRNGFGNNVQTEPLVTEFSAMYAGPKAFSQETEEYRLLIKNNFLGEQKYKLWTDPHQMERMPAFQYIQNLFSKNTWRSWRTWEVAGGMIPWSLGHGWVPTITANTKVAMPEFKPGRMGNYFSEASARQMNFLQPDAWQTMPGGQAISENNNAILAYIAGGEAAFTEKDHHFKNGDWLKKQFFFFNDTRVEQTCHWEAKLLISGKEYFKDSGSVHLPIGEKKSHSFIYQLPVQQAAFKQEGQLILSATINRKICRDTFDIRLFNPKPVQPKEVFVYDPEGKTTAMLQTLGYTIKSWDGVAAIPFLIVGRNALFSTYAMHFNLENFVSNGGKVLVMNQHPDSVAAKKGFRVSPYISRYVFPVDGAHDLFVGLDEKDFRNWTGESKLTVAYPDYVNGQVRKGSDDVPYHGWHWGNRGGVATGAVEKPHRTAWRPLLECEFDAAWTPLMELPYGKGHLVSSYLDLEDHYDQDVVAAMIAERLVNYIDTLKPAPRSIKTILLGNSKDTLLLDDIGINYTRSESIPANTALVIVGNVSGEQEGKVLQFIKGGGKALILPRNSSTNFLEVTYIEKSEFEGGYQIPRWLEAKGLSVSDTRYRTNFNTIVIASGCEISANGLLGRKNIGKGTAVFVQLDPNRFNADTLTYFRFTRWRQTRALAQVAANMGASFIMDKAFFGQRNEVQLSVPLDGKWKAAMTAPLPSVKDVKDKYKDPGISAEAEAYLKPDAEETKMVEIQSGNDFEKERREWSGFDGEIVYRKKIDVPSSMIGEDLSIILGALDDYDQVYFNGVLIGKTGIEKEPVWSYDRTYTIPAKLVKQGSNVIAIRIFDTYGGGGIMPSQKRREIVPAIKRKVQGFYHPDYIDDFAMGDDPFRYFRW